MPRWGSFCREDTIAIEGNGDGPFSYGGTPCFPRVDVLQWTHGCEVPPFFQSSLFRLLRDRNLETRTDRSGAVRNTGHWRVLSIATQTRHRAYCCAVYCSQQTTSLSRLRENGHARRQPHRTAGKMMMAQNLNNDQIVARFTKDGGKITSTHCRAC